MAKTKITWAEESWNPITGCDQISEGCDNCYAMRMAARLKRMDNPRYQNDGEPPRSGPGFGLTVHEDKIGEPLRWKKPRRVFVNSMSDLFHEEIGLNFLEQVFDVMGKCQRHTFQILTKRHRAMHRLLAGGWPYYSPCSGPLADHRAEPLPNVWLGVSVENQQWADARIPWLLQTPAAVRWLSVEPLLGPVDLGPWIENLNWIVAGGESGPGARPCDPAWLRSIRDQCQAAGVPFFLKQLGGVRDKRDGAKAVLDGRTWTEYPA